MIKTIAFGLLIAACSNDQNYDDVYTGPVHGKISGVVTTTDGVPLQGVSVSAQDVSSTTYEDGTYVLEDVDPNDNIVLTFTKQGYAKNYTTTQLHSWETVNSNVSLLEADGFEVINASVSNNINIGDTKIRFSENSFLNSDGTSYTGEVTVQVTHVDTSTSEIWGAPADMTAIAYSPQGSQTQAKNTTALSQLVSYGMVDVTLFGSAGEELNISNKSPAFLEIPITNGDLPETYHLNPGDTQVSWSFDPTLGIWVEEGVGNIVEEDGKTFFQFEADHFSWWNCDQGFVPSCATGRVVDVLGFPIRGAEVTCDGNQTTSTAVTDDDGYYVCSILVGDQVTFTGTTFVDQRNWLKSTNKFMDGEGSSAAECEPIDTIQIDVCRIAGTVNVQNIAGKTETDSNVNSDNVGAFFWEPPGDVEYCNDHLSALSVGECWVGTHDNIQRSFPEGVIPGIPDDSRSVGTWFEVRTEKELYRIDRESVTGQPNYTWDSHSVDGTEVSDSRPEFNPGDILDAQAPGDFSSYFGAWEIEEFAVIPDATEFDIGEALLTVDGSTSVTYNNSSQDEVFVSAYAGETQMFCKFEDKGNFLFNPTGLDAGFGGLSVFHLETEFFAGPDGLPIKTQVFSGETLPVNIK